MSCFLQTPLASALACSSSVAVLPNLMTGTYLEASGKHNSLVVLLSLDSVVDLVLVDVVDALVFLLHKNVAMPVPDRHDDAMLPPPCCSAS